MTDVVRLETLIDAALETLGYHLVEFEYAKEQGGWVLRVFIDHPATGRADRAAPPRRVTHEDCGRASRHLGAVLDVEDPIDSAYRLEVSSPGVMRPIRKKRDFERFVGFAVKVQMKEALEGRRNFVGKLVAVGDQDVMVEADGQTFELPVRGIKKARLNEEY